MDLVLTGADAYNKTAAEKLVGGVWKRLMRTLVPDIFVEVISVDLVARLEVELDMRTNTVVFFFVDEPKPHVKWNLEFSLTKAQIPLIGENSLDSLLTHALQGIDKDNPIQVSF